VTDEPELPFVGLDAERPLAPELRARLEAALLAAVAGGLPVPADAESLDAPRPLPEPLRARLESALLAEATSTPAAAAAASPSIPAAAAGVASPSSSAPVGDVVSLARRRRKIVAAWSSVAAVLLLVVAVAGLAGRGGNSGSGSLEAAGGPTTTSLESPAPLPSGAGDSTDATSPATTAPASPTTRATRPPRPSPSTTGPKTPGAGGNQGEPAPTTPTVPTSSEPSGGDPATDPGTPPPFYNSPPPGESSGAAPAMSSGPPAAASPSGGSQDAAPPNQTQKSATPAPAGSRLRVGIIPGDAAQEAGFRAYINRLNQSGGVSGHGIDLVTVGPGAPATNTIATVNLSSQPVAGPGGAPSWATGPLLETLTATADLLPGNRSVFSFASPPERQGHLAADALFPTSVSGGAKAVIYVPPGAGPLRDSVPEAIKAVLKERNVTAEFVTYRPGTDQPLTPADAAFISLDPTAAKAWVAQAKADGYRPAAGVAGIYSLADETLLPDLPESARVVSPYVVPGGDEGQAIRSEGRGTSAPVLHGWATAKSLAAALWRTGADPAQVQAGLEGLTGWSSGLAPPYETRPGTRSRTPEGIVLQVQSQAFVAQGGFRRDPY
jgi:hypothetical protein